MNNLTPEENIYHDFNFLCEEIYRLVVQGKDTTMSIKEMFSFLETISAILKDRADVSKYDKGIETTLLSDGRTVGEYHRQLSKVAILTKLVKLDNLENRKREKNRKRRTKSHEHDEVLD
jgi:hypothetical protein